MSKVKFPPRVRIFCAFDNFERKIKVSGADRYFGIPMNPPGKPYEAISIAEHNHLISQLEERLRVAELKLRRFSAYGTDGCSSCETGRVTLFVANDRCIQCDPKSYEAPSAIKEKKE